MEMGFGGGSECVAFELHRTWLSLEVDSRAITSVLTEPDAQVGISFAAPWLATRGFRSRWRRIATLLAVPVFTLIATWRVYRARGLKVVLSHGDCLLGDVCVVHAVNRASIEEKRRVGQYAWLLNPTNLWVAWRDWWMLDGRRYRRVVAISERVRNQIKEYYGVPDEDIVTIPNGVNLSRFHVGTPDERSTVRQKFQVPVNAPLVLFVGNQYRLKGLEFAIRALSIMDTKAYLLVAGGDNPVHFRRMAEQLGVGDRVIFAGLRSDMPEIYRAVDALVLPTLYETFALVCLEAMASGVPVLATRVGGVEDYLVDNVNGLYIEREAVDIAVKLQQVLNDSRIRTSLIDQGLETAQNYSWEKIAKRYLVLFDELIRERIPNSRSLLIAKSRA